MKDTDKRAVALHPELANALRAARPEKVDPTQQVFWWCWPTYDILQGHLKQAGIERKDGLGRVVHFHSLRKTLQTLGVQNNMNQRAAQEIFGHSDANLTAEVYTDVAAIQMHSEIAKIPWISGGEILAQHSAQKSGVSGLSVSLPDMKAHFVELVQASGAEAVMRALASAVTSLPSNEMAARAGIEPATK